MRRLTLVAAAFLAATVVSADPREAEINQTIVRIQDRLNRRSWIPIYGFFLRLRGDAELSRLTLERTRLQTARIQAVQGSR